MAAEAAEPQWSGDSAYRVLVEVSPVEFGMQRENQSVAAWEVDFAKTLQSSGIDGWVDLSTLQVHRYDPTTGEAEAFTRDKDQSNPYDWPCRFDDDVLPEAYPGRIGRASETTDGRPREHIRSRKGRIFNRLTDPASGRVVWVHREIGNEPSHYAIYFDTTDSDQPQVSPAPWIGDADVLREEQGQHLGGFSHFMTAVGDLNGDGLFDLVAGVEKGDLMWFPNVGEQGTPRFIGCQILADERGPIDTGWYAAPYLYDWDNDGRIDLLAGTSGNVILWWKNVGKDTAPRWHYQGFVQADGQRLEVPESPVDEDANGIFKADYFNQPWVGDWDGDGLLDLLAGGYTTGRIFHYKATRHARDQPPQLTFVGELEADGQPIDTTWAAAPLAGDFDGDGDLDLVTGTWWWSGISHPPTPGQDDYLFYFRNEGSVTEPQLVRAEFPRAGPFPQGNIARPSAVDWNDDGLIDLLVSDNSGKVYAFINEGDARHPRWRMTDQSLTVPWGFVSNFPLTGSWIDFGGDGSIETLAWQSIRRLEGTPHRPKLTPLGHPTVNDRPIDHPGPGYGDGYLFTVATDWDKDGLGDILWGTQQGEVYLHRGLTKDQGFSFSPGEPLKLINGQPLRLGPEVVDSSEQATDFTILQGSRIVFDVADFNADGIDDLIATETYGNIWVFLNTEQGGTDTLQLGVKVATMPGRTDALNTLDWNHDGKLDLLTEGTTFKPGEIWINESDGDRLALAAPIHPLELPYVFWGPRFRNVDWNGDGDEDLLINSEFFSFWVERSFLDHGYAQARTAHGPASTPEIQRRPEQESRP